MDQNLEHWHEGDRDFILENFKFSGLGLGLVNDSNRVGVEHWDTHTTRSNFLASEKTRFGTVRAFVAEEILWEIDTRY